MSEELDYQSMLLVAIEEARKGLAEGGIPIGAALFDREGKELMNVGTKDLFQQPVFSPDSKRLAVIKADDYDDALRIANDTPFGLTGAVYSTDEARLERARNEFHVGNLYLNRKCTGAMVGVHPFGGFNMSGTDSKAGGRDYLLLFMQAKVSSAKVGATQKRAEAGTAI